MQFDAKHSLRVQARTASVGIAGGAVPIVGDNGGDAVWASAAKDISEPIAVDDVPLEEPSEVTRSAKQETIKTTAPVTINTKRREIPLVVAFVVAVS